MKTTGKYILQGKEVVPVYDLLEWAEWFETACVNGQCTIADTKIGNIRVSTVFLSLDYSFGLKPENPILFETNIFGGKHDQYQSRCCTYDVAVEMHKVAVELVNSK